jgi:transposase-like protein
LAQVDQLVAEGKTLSEATRQVGISRQTLYRWRGQSVGMEAPPASRLSELESENARLRKIVADLLLQKTAIEEQLDANGQRAQVRR